MYEYFCIIYMQDALRLLIGLEVITRRQNIVDLLGIITNETELKFPSIIDDIHRGKYGEVNKYIFIPISNKK